MATKYRAALMLGPGKQLEVTSIEAAQPGLGEVRIKNFAVALQPLDTKMLIAGYGTATQFKYPAVLGTSGAGTIDALGQDVTGLKVGDRVVFDTKAYVQVDQNRRMGTWQQLVICDAKTVAKIGDVAFEQAVLVDFPLQTAVAALHVFLGMGKLNSGKEDGKVLIWGAGGAVGSYAVQYAKQVGHEVVVTASPRDIDRQKRLGASEVVDYKATDVVEQLRTLGPYKYLFTASGDQASQKALVSLLAPKGGKFASVLPAAVELPSNVEIIYTAFSQAAQKDEYSDWRDWWYQDYLPEVLAKGSLEPSKFTKVEGGLSALQQASQDVFDGKFRGKVVVDPQE
ncbi:oxidoreductase domain-containing protein [Cucurbitaria berberidis CBS 394.84]|uniref:Oxidoreductase domain-containing protein n=1 Tax=Cucurbitaria berberidis CBS 394.84 TaxID=1168544 RepID=A0A9P4GFQ7_9PLEO|nr:oxidoreductase domain-containing protein [Cucurbitaria berberidis CBS 394.84]KAF1844404.1 oxidoreductase domain-containing protein [Cucurbitaria berberidis CBS 394.84]